VFVWKSIKSLFKSIDRWGLYLLAGWLIFNWAPVAWKNFRMESQSVSAQKNGLESFSMRPLVLVFWATWCTPCSVELRRIQRLIDSGSLSKGSVLAITQESDHQKVNREAKERGYSFKILFDSDGTLHERFKVESTPTLVVLGESNEILWLTSGLSPTLEIRLKHFLDRQE